MSSPSKVTAPFIRGRSPKTVCMRVDFPRTVGAEDRNDLVLVDMQRDPVENG